MSEEATWGIGIIVRWLLIIAVLILTIWAVYAFLLKPIMGTFQWGEEEEETILTGCERIRFCDDYYSARACGEDACNLSCVPDYDDCSDPNTYTGCMDCPSPCKISDYCSGSEFDWLRELNPCNCEEE